MATRKVDIEVKVRLVLNVDEGAEIGEIMDEMDYNFVPDVDSPADIVDTEILDYEIKDSK